MPINQPASSNLRPDEIPQAAQNIGTQIDVLANEQANAQLLNTLDLNHLALLRLQHRVLRSHLGQTQMDRLRGMHRLMEAHIKTLTSDQSIDPERRKKLVAELTEMRTALAPSLLHGEFGDYAQDVKTNVEQFAKQNPETVQRGMIALAVAGGVAAVTTLGYYLWHQSRDFSHAAAAGLIAGLATAVAGVGTVLSIPWLTQLAERLRKSREEQNLQSLTKRIETNEKLTTQRFTEFEAARKTSATSPDANNAKTLAQAIKLSRDAIEQERKLLSDATINLFVATPDRQKQLRARLERLPTMTKQLEDADTRNAPPRTTEPGAKTNVQTEVKEKNDKVGAGPQVKTDVQGQQNTKVIPPRNERGPVGEADRKEVEGEKAKVDAAIKKKLEEDAKLTPPPQVQPPPGPNGQPTQEIDPVTGLPRTPPPGPTVPPTQPTPVPNNEQNNNNRVAELKRRQGLIKTNTDSLMGQLTPGQNVDIADPRLQAANPELSPNILALPTQAFLVGGIPTRFERVGNEYRLVVNGQRFSLGLPGSVLNSAQIVTLNGQQYLRTNYPAHYYIPMTEVQRVVQAAATAGNLAQIPVPNVQYLSHRGIFQGEAAYPTLFQVTEINGTQVPIVNQRYNLTLTRVPR